MSWDAWVEMPTGTGNHLSGESRNYTHNCNKMMYRALGAVWHEGLLDRLHDLDGKPCLEAASILAPALKWWREQPPGAMDDIAPANGWGDSESALEFWTWVCAECNENPAAILRLNG